MFPRNWYPPVDDDQRVNSILDLKNVDLKTHTIHDVQLQKSE